MNLQKIVFLGAFLLIIATVGFLSKPVEIQTQTVTKVIDNARFE